VPAAIEFPDRPSAWYDIDDHTLTFPVRIDGIGYACVIAVRDMMQRFADSPPVPAEAFAVYEAHRDEIRRLAEIVVRATPPVDEYHRYPIGLVSRIGRDEPVASRSTSRSDP
jgi:Protein of unknown function (DUF1488)